MIDDFTDFTPSSPRPAPRARPSPVAIERQVVARIETTLGRPPAYVVVLAVYAALLTIADMLVVLAVLATYYRPHDGREPAHPHAKGHMFATLVWDNQKDAGSTVDIRGDSTLVDRLKALDCDWFKVEASSDKAKSLGLAAEAVKHGGTPVIVLQEEGKGGSIETTNVPSDADGVAALVQKWRGKIP